MVASETDSVDTMMTFSTGASGCPGIFPLSTVVWKHQFVQVEFLSVSIFIFKLYWVLSLAKSFLFMFSIILAWSNTSSLQGGWFELKEEF